MAKDRIQDIIDRAADDEERIRLLLEFFISIAPTTPQEDETLRKFAAALASRGRPVLVIDDSRIVTVPGVPTRHPGQVRKTEFTNSQLAHLAVKLKFGSWDNVPDRSAQWLTGVINTYLNSNYPIPLAPGQKPKTITVPRRTVARLMAQFL
jgi:hypothetical protein